jgi:hypothetical protein
MDEDEFGLRYISFTGCIWTSYGCLRETKHSHCFALSTALRTRPYFLVWKLSFVLPCRPHQFYICFHFCPPYQKISASKVDTNHAPLNTKTRLPGIYLVSLSLHRALHHFRPLSDGYADMPYAEGFELELPVNEREWYIVAFHSIQKDSSDGRRQSLKSTCNSLVTNWRDFLYRLALYETDKLAHEGAVRNGGVCLSSYPHLFIYCVPRQLIMYWYGVPNPRTRKKRNPANTPYAANSYPHHVRAMTDNPRSCFVWGLYSRHTLRNVKGKGG